MRIVASKKYAFTMLNYARDLFKIFVKNFSLLFGEHYVTYNVHGLLHICADVEMYGPVDVFSGFKFENFLQI